MKSYKRSQRVAALIQKECADIIRDIKDLNYAIVTIMGVRLTDDLLTCKIDYSVFGGQQEKEAAAKILDKNLKEIRHQLAIRLNLRRTPEISFYYDNTNETASKVFDILKKIEDEKTNK
ncbi:MAG: 30S ribosome-binding factor RbfA [Endomicrobium sp.]|jgi:ribosome-binding factor A|nr:30S ribosome-binding factor RbfA [Endomicrobium sp.]